MVGAPEQVLQVADEAVDVALAGRLVDDVFVVVVAETATEFLVVHLGLVLADAPTARHLVRVGEFELPAVAGPRDKVLATLVGQQFQKELPQLDGARTGEAGRRAGRTALVGGQHRRLDDWFRFRRAHRRTEAVRQDVVAAVAAVLRAAALLLRVAHRHHRRMTVAVHVRRMVLHKKNTRPEITTWSSSYLS